jgi:hypothetical protein
VLISEPALQHAAPPAPCGLAAPVWIIPDDILCSPPHRHAVLAFEHKPRRAITGTAEVVRLVGGVRIGIEQRAEAAGDSAWASAHGWLLQLV